VVKAISLGRLRPGPETEETASPQCARAIAGARRDNLEPRSVEGDAAYRTDVRDSRERGATAGADDHSPADDANFAE
jgi:hypothetical protein